MTPYLEDMPWIIIAASLAVVLFIFIGAIAAMVQESARLNARTQASRERMYRADLAAAAKRLNPDG